MVRIPTGELDIAKIAGSGQCFRIREIPAESLPAQEACSVRCPSRSPEKKKASIQSGRWQVLAKDRRLEILQEEGSPCCTLCCSRTEYNRYWKNYFDMDTDYRAMDRAIDPADSYLSAAAACSRGLRILRQDPWEMLITFILSQRKNIPAIAACVEKLCAAFGEEKDGFHAFPTPQALAAASEDALRSCGLGYRAPYVADAARRVAGGQLKLDEAARLDDAALLEALTGVSGVGIKVASCTALFGFHRIDAFPVDVWIQRVLDAHYGGSFPVERYRGFAGVMQQYLFCYGRAEKENKAANPPGNQSG